MVKLIQDGHITAEDIHRALGYKPTAATPSASGALIGLGDGSRLNLDIGPGAITPAYLQGGVLIVGPSDGDGDGEPGPPGPPGRDGTAGTIGRDGAMGPLGFGEQGEQGDWGPPGFSGPTGATGSTGPAGPIGFGLEGEPGEDGVFVSGIQGPPGQSGAMVLLATSSPSGTGTVTFSSISQIYKDLLLIIRGRGTVSATSTEVKMTFNNDSAGNYGNQITDVITTAAPATTTATTATESRPGFITGATSPSGNPGSIEVRIFDYSDTTFNKHAIYHNGLWFDTTSFFQRWGNSTWKSTAAINRIDVVLVSGNFAAGSLVSLYGITG